MTVVLDDVSKTVNVEPVQPPRARILQTAREMFHQFGIHAVGVEAIATAAQTNKMTLYRHFSSKDELIAATILELKKENEIAWELLAQAYPHDPRAHLNAWLEQMYLHVQATESNRVCSLLHKAIEIPDAQHPARLAIEEVKREQINRVAELCRASRLNDPIGLADQLFIVFEGARVSKHIGTERLESLVPSLIQALVAAHE